jgi:hypothetical protein
MMMKKYTTSNEAYADYWALKEKIDNMNILDSKLEETKNIANEIYSIAVKLQNDGK